MSLAVLKTKLYIPPVRSGKVLRSRLLDRLDEGVHHGCRLTLVSAPAGYGKTTLLASWLAQGDPCAAWLSLDEGDNDPARFWAYVY
jgi:LuxR family transcriptional regulator, maltose regulon positive regulatory protein